MYKRTQISSSTISNINYEQIFSIDSLVEEIIKFIDFPEVLEFASIDVHFKNIIYEKHHGSKTHMITNISNYLDIFKNPQSCKIGSIVNVKLLKNLLVTCKSIKYLDISNKKINTNIFEGVNLDNIEELVITKFPNNNIQLFSYFKNLKSFTCSNKTYIPHKDSFVSCTNNSMIGDFNIIYKFYYPDGKILYDGNWKNGKYNGNGIYYHENGKIMYDGNWENDNMHGNGIEYYENGKILYHGNWENDKMHGKGIYYYQN